MNDIIKLKFPDNIRTRYSLYAGSNENSTILFRELIDNTIDLVLKTRISIDTVAYSNTEYKLVYDDGPGMPLFKDKDYEDQSIILDLLTSTHVGSNFKRVNYSCGLNGVGGKIPVAASDEYFMIINASKTDFDSLPEYLKTQYSNVQDDLKLFIIKFNKGIQEFNGIYDKNFILDKLANTDVIEEVERLITPELGTLVIFKPDLEVVESSEVVYDAYPFKLINKYFINDSDFRNVNFTLSLNDKSIDEFNFRDVFKDELIKDKVFDYSFNYKTEESHPIKFLGSFAFALDSMDSETNGSVNLLRTPSGKHIKIVRSALGKALRKFNGLLSSSDIKYGLRLFSLLFSVKPDYDSQTKVRLTKIDDLGFDETDCIDELSNYFYDEILNKDDDSKEFFTNYCVKVLEYKKSLEKLSKKEFIFSQIKYSANDPVASLGLGSKVYECASKDINKRELYIVEGKSAGSSIIRIRDPKIHAVLPTRGVPLNSVTSSLKRVLQNQEFKSLINILGTGIDPYIKMNKKRYGKVIIACDPDHAGKFITSLLLGFFGMYLLPWIENGLVYVLRSPLYRQDGKYIYDESELNKRKPFTRFKGLGELSAKDARTTLIDNRKLVKITSDDYLDAIKLLINENNERKDLSKELGILVKYDEFSELFDDEDSELLGLSTDEESDDDDE